ncbi:MAG: YceI family protein [Thermomicrobiales bacterium]|nr:YceI family protein [Thermomicrobiales bacterium]
MNATRYKIAGALAAVVLLGAIGIWYQFFRDDAPPPASLDAAVSALAPTAAPTEAATATTATSVATGLTSAAIVTQTPSVATEVPSETSTGDGLAGEWTVVAQENAFVGYRIGEELASIGTTEAVGRTSDVIGTLTIDGTNLTAATITVDMTTLESDESRRDRALNDQALETRAFPEATFVLTEPVELPVGLADGESVSVTATGTLTLHGVEQTVQIPMEAQVSGDTLVVVGSLDISLADYGISQPQSPAVVSVQDHGTLELQLYFERTT